MTTGKIGTKELQLDVNCGFRNLSMPQFRVHDEEVITGVQEILWKLIRTYLILTV